MKKVIVSTTINSKTRAFELFDELEDWDLVVAGDLKTPLDYSLKRGTYLSPRDQHELDKDLSELIGWNCIQRRNFALLYAFQLGAEFICMVDDDNVPLQNWGEKFYLDKESKFKQYTTSEIAFDAIGATKYRHLWHRGFPLELIHNRSYSNTTEVKLKPGIQANFWNGDPDIDAICRIEHRPECYFENDTFPFTSNSIAPFNSQNTVISREVLKDYFLFPHIGRMDDIWASFYVQALGHKVIFAEATVFQSRNPHNLIEDMKKEYLGYENNLRLLSELTQDSNAINNYLPSRSKEAWQRYKELMSIV
jgi:hypothetical protein